MFELKQQPEHLAIIGSDQITTKFAGSMNGLISKVTLHIPLLSLGVRKK